MPTMIIPAGWYPVGEAVYSTVSSAIELADAPDAGDALPASADTAIMYFSGDDIHANFTTGDADANDPKYPQSNYLVVEGGRDVLVGFSAIEASASGRIDIWYFNVSGRGRTN